LVESLEQTNCIVCGAKTPVPLYSGFDRLFGIEGEFKVVTCSNCGFVYSNPRLPEREMEKFYPEQYYSFQEWTEEVGFFRAFYRKMKWKSLSRFNMTRMSSVPRFIISGRIMDFGCGSGGILGILKKIGWETYGIEKNEEAVKYARSKGLEVFAEDLKFINFPDEHFDVIRMHSVVEHLYDAPQILGEIHRILKKDGSLLLICPNIAGFSSRLFKSRWFHLDLPRHLYHFSLTSLTRLLKKHNYRIFSIRSCGSGGILGSLDYLLNEKNKKYGTKLCDNKVLRLIVFLTLEFWVNRLKLGDLIEVQARKI